MKRIFAMALATLVSASACSDPYIDPIPPRDTLNYPIGLTVHPNGRYLYVVNSNFDTRYREDVGGTLSIVDLETYELQTQTSPFLPSFGGFVRLNRDATRAYVSARHDNSIVSLEVSPRGNAIYCRSGVDGTTSDPSDCLIQRVPDVPGGARIPSDPYALDVTTIDWVDEEGVPFEVDLLNMAHLRGDNVTSIAIPRRDSDEGAQATATTMKFASLVTGGSALARRPGTRDFYVGGRASREIGIYSPYLAPDTAAIQALIRRGSIALGNVGQSVETRGMAFEPTGERLYVVTRAPDALHLVDLGPSNPDTGGGTLRKAVESIAIARNPSGVFYKERQGASRPARLYVPSLDEQIIQVIDPETMGVVDRIEIEARPYDFVFDPARDRAYVSLFDDLPAGDGRCEEHRTEPCGSVGIIDLDPDSPRYHTLIGKIN